mmetsp:Transcript_23702/g.55228  ORF Transcript_23702/g.55228 Transcript_23702/m.55228 type:complete len:95 (+) Transcript_23702:1136-1420(+)
MICKARYRPWYLVSTRTLIPWLGHEGNPQRENVCVGSEARLLLVDWVHTVYCISKLLVNYRIGNMFYYEWVLVSVSKCVKLHVVSYKYPTHLGG